MKQKRKKILVAYFSHTGGNFVNGKITDLKKGNTETVAKMLAKLTGADLFEIRSVKKYPEDYHACTEVAQEEFRANIRPELVKDKKVAPYDVIILGFPCWWGTMPMPVWTFLEYHSFQDKIILPYCTHEGSGMGSSESNLKKLLPDADVRKGLAIRGSDIGEAEPLLEKWLSDNRI